MTQLTAVFETVDPLCLVFHISVDAVAARTGSWELIRRGNLHERIPIIGRVNLRRIDFARGNVLTDRDLISGTHQLLGGIQQSITPAPNVEPDIGDLGN